MTEADLAQYYAEWERLQVLNQAQQMRYEHNITVLDAASTEVTPEMVRVASPVASGSV